MTSILLASLASLAMGQAHTDVKLLRYPTIHGDTVVFTYAGDLWSWNLKGGLAQRLTTFPGEEMRARISPDGKQIVFMGSYDGAPDLFLTSIEGGEPKRLTFDPGPEAPLCWTPSGKIAFTSGHGGMNGTLPRLKLISPQGGLPESTAVLEAAQGTFSADGTTFVYQRMNGQNQWWRHYRGGTQPFISLYNLKTNEYSELPHKREMAAFPMSVGDGVFYISDKNQGTMNLYRFDLRSKSDKQLTSFSDADIRWPSTDGHSIVFERNGYLWRYDIASAKVDQLKPEIVDDQWNARPALRKLGQQVEGFALSPSGARLALVARGKLFSVPAKNGETRRLTDSNGPRERFPVWMPNGKSIAYFSDASGEDELYMRPAMGGDATKLTSVKGLIPTSLRHSPDGKYLSFTTRNFELYTIDVDSKQLKLIYKDPFQGSIAYDWSPDCKWIAYIETGNNGFGRATLYEMATGKSTNVNDGMFKDDDVAFDASGKYLYFVSNRTFSPTFGIYEFSLKVENAARIYIVSLSKDLPNPLTPPVDEEGGAPASPAAGGGNKIDWDGLAQRATVLPLEASNYRLVAGLSDGLLYASPAGVFKFDLRSRDSQPVLGAGTYMALNASNSKVAYMSGGQVFIQDLRPGLQPGPGRVDLGSVDAVVDPKAEWNQMFWETWRWERGLFYNPDMNGLNWDALGKKYASYLDSVSNRNDLAYVLGQLIGELGTGHAYVQGFPSPTVNPVAVGALGADYKLSGDKVVFEKIYAGNNGDESLRSPLGEVGVNVAVGDVLVAIDGKRINARVSPSEALQGKVGRSVALTVATNGVERQVRVRPIADESRLRYFEWIEDNRKLVTKLSGGRLGYMHIPNTSSEGAIALIRGYYSQTDKEGMVVDERFNGGGYIQPWFVATLARSTQAMMKRNSGKDDYEAVSIEGPKCLLINSYAGSGGDFFPWMFKQNRLGPLIGTRTWGGLVGISGSLGLIDGGTVTSPEFGIYDHRAGEWIAENKGVDPDIVVDARPDLIAQGRDPQLEKAVEYLMGELKKPRPQPKSPKFPTIPPGR